MLFLFNRFFGGRYGSLLRAGVGVVCVVVGLVWSSKVLLLIGAVFVVWGLVTGIGTLTGRGPQSPTDGDGGNERTRFDR